MLKATIYLDDVVFSGIDDDEDRTIAWGQEPKLAWGRRNILGYVSRILLGMGGKVPMEKPVTLRIEIEDDRAC